MMKENIVFFGDSFAGHSLHASGPHQLSTKNTTLRSYIDIVSNNLHLNPICMGFPATSWWYSFNQLNTFIDRNKDQWDNTSTVVACLTSSGRPKILNEEHLFLFKSTKIKKNYYQYDERAFDQWAYQKFIEEFYTITLGKKVILFICFPFDLWICEEFKDLFSICTIALFNISLSEFPKAKQKDLNFFADDSRANHMSMRNNFALAKDITYRIQNYKTGLWMISEELYQIQPADDTPFKKARILAQG